VKKIVIKTTLILAVTFTYSCGNKTNEVHDLSKTESVIETEAHHNEENKLVLDNGKLWNANPETTIGVNNMIDLMNSFSDKNNVEAYDKLYEDLQTEFTMIFQKCTMTGESHNQLHNFLLPIKKLFVGLNSNNLEDCQDSYEKLSRHLKEYKNFFK